jgi:hypothetical protein
VDFIHRSHDAASSRSVPVRSSASLSLILSKTTLPLPMMMISHDSIYRLTSQYRPSRDRHNFFATGRLQLLRIIALAVAAVGSNRQASPFLVEPFLDGLGLRLNLLETLLDCWNRTAIRQWCPWSVGIMECEDRSSVARTGKQSPRWSPRLIDVQTLYSFHEGGLVFVVVVVVVF